MGVFEKLDTGALFYMDSRYQTAIDIALAGTAFIEPNNIFLKVNSRVVRTGWAANTIKKAGIACYAPSDPK